MAIRWTRCYRPTRIDGIVLQETDILSFLTLDLPVSGQTHPWLTVLRDADFDVAIRVEA